MLSMSLITTINDSYSPLFATNCHADSPLIAMNCHALPLPNVNANLYHSHVGGPTG